ncbi:SCO family protein [Bacteroidota bacterium]
MKKSIIILILITVSISCNKNKVKVSSAIPQKAVNTLPFFNSAEFTPEWIDEKEETYKSIHTIPDFSFINQEGVVISKEDYKDKIYVANFFFTTCTGICRSLSLQMKKVQEEFEGDPNVFFLSHSVTPELDSVPVLKKYAVDYGINSKKWNLVTGNKKEIYELARTAYFSDEDFIKTKEASEFIHTENFLLIDKKGRIRGVYNGTLTLETKRLIKHIYMLKNEN